MRAPDIARVVIESFRAQGRRVLIGSGWADLALIDDADDCFAVGEASHQALFRRVAAVVHHGGAGTTTTAAVAGAPQVVVPQLADQPYWARRVAELGIGAAHNGPTPTTESLSAALRTALAPETPRTSKRRGRHDPPRRGDSGREAAPRRSQPGKAAGGHVTTRNPRARDRRATAPASSIIVLEVS